MSQAIRDIANHPDGPGCRRRPELGEVAKSGSARVSRISPFRPDLPCFPLSQSASVTTIWTDSLWSFCFTFGLHNGFNSPSHSRKESENRWFAV
jgi:hypothetical protein